MAGKTYGAGIAVFDVDDEVTGEVHHVTTPKEVIDLTDEDLSSVVGLVRAGTSAFASPLLANDVHALVTMEGAPTSHLGILAREYGIPCVMSLEPAGEFVEADPGTAAFFEEWGQFLDGREVGLRTTTEGATIRGEIYDAGGDGR